MRTLLESCVIICIAVAMGLVVNQLRPDGLPLVSDWSVQAQLAEKSGLQDRDMVISMEEAGEAFFSKKALFLDARPEELYEAGHISGARNLPSEWADDYFDKIMAYIPVDAMIIAYCDGESCSLSKDLALYLFFRGYDNVRVLVNGWSRWLEAGLPVTRGPEWAPEPGGSRENGEHAKTE